MVKRFSMLAAGLTALTLTGCVAMDEEYGYGGRPYYGYTPSYGYGSTYGYDDRGYGYGYDYDRARERRYEERRIEERRQRDEARQQREAIRRVERGVPVPPPMQSNRPRPPVVERAPGGGIVTYPAPSDPPGTVSGH